MHMNLVSAEIGLSVSEDASLGGAIVFSTDVNTVRLHRVKLLNWLFQRVKTFWQRVFLMKKISLVISWMNDNQVEQIRNLTIHQQCGIYISPSGQKFLEKSIRLELAGCSRMLLTETAKIILQDFYQQSVMVVCYDEGVKYHIHV